MVIGLTPVFFIVEHGALSLYFERGVWNLLSIVSFDSSLTIDLHTRQVRRFIVVNISNFGSCIFHCLLKMDVKKFITIRKSIAV
jgi:hypothetical protein